MKKSILKIVQKLVIIDMMLDQVYLNLEIIKLINNKYKNKIVMMKKTIFLKYKISHKNKK